MNVFRLPSVMALWMVVGIAPAFAQNSFQFESENTYAAATAVDPTASSTSSGPKMYHSQKKLPQLYSGFAIEVATSDYPLQQSNPIFRQFGNLHYEKHRTGGYSYLILASFSSREAALNFVKTIIQPRAGEAILFEYKDGTRKAIRE